MNLIWLKTKQAPVARSIPPGKNAHQLLFFEIAVDKIGSTHHPKPKDRMTTPIFEFIPSESRSVKKSAKPNPNPLIVVPCHQQSKFVIV